MCFKVPNKRVTRQNKAASASNSELNESALASYAKNMTGAVGVELGAPGSPKVLSVSNQADVLPFNTEIGVQPKGILP